MKRQLTFLVIIVLVMSLLASGCTDTAKVAQTNTAAGDHVKKLVVGNMDLASSTSLNSFTSGVFGISLSQPGLTVLDSRGNIVPGLAESWETKDAKKWVFHIRNNATWDDGVPVTANDVKFSYDCRVEKKKPDSYTLMVESMEVPDNYTLIINLKQPRSNLINLSTNFLIYPMHVFKDVEDPTTYAGSGSMLGYGPYRLDSFDVNAGILTFKANDKYWGGKPSIDEIEWRIYKNTDTMMMALQKGEIDTVTTLYGGINYYYVPKLLNNENLGFSITPNLAVPMGIWFNVNRPPFDNEQLREAISYAFNYDELCNLFTGGYGTTPNAGFLPNGTSNFAETRKLVYDVNKSRQLLDSAGFADRDGDGFRELPDGTKFQPEIILRNDRPAIVRMAQMIKTYMNNVGIDVQIKAADYNLWWDAVSTYKVDMTIGLTTYLGITRNEGYGSIYFDQRSQGYSNITDTRYTTLIDELLATTDQDKASEMGREIQKYYASELPAIPLYWDSTIVPYNKRYTGWTFHPMWGPLSYETFYDLRVAR